MKVVTIIQARMGSTRLPGKVLKKVMGKPLLEYQIERVQRSGLTDELVIATSSNKEDEVINEFCKKSSVTCFRGSETDVLGRYYHAALASKADAVVRLTADCPLIDPEVIDKVVRFYITNAPVYQYGSNTGIRTYPRGMDTSIFSFQALEEAHHKANTPYEREHVTPFIIKNKERYPSFNITYDKDASHHRWTVDTIEDFTLVEKVLEDLYPQNKCFTLKETLQAFQKNPEWMKINANIKQKDV